MLTTQPHLAPRLRMCLAIPLLSLYAIVFLTGTDLPCTAHVPEMLRLDVKGRI